MRKITFSDKNFNLKDTFDCGQCFRWEEKDGSYEGVAGGFYGRFTAGDGEILLETNCPDDEFWTKYLDIERDYSVVIQNVSVNPLMEKAVSYGKGIRLLKQEFFETLISFIISQRSSIPKIKTSVKRICEKWGKKITEEGITYHTFPTAEMLKTATEEDFREIGVGYRAPYIVRCIEKVNSGELTEEMLTSLTTPEAREMLMTLHGVGDKVCDCVMLFSLAKFDLFPSDVWIKRVMCESFGSSEKTAKEDGEKLFGAYSGFAQQYLFYYRKNME